jgi:nucleotide-binding universal stress UspA family protein
MKLRCSISKALLPVDGSEHSKRAVQFTGCLGASLEKGFSDLALLRVITGSYLGQHISYVDFRAEVLKESETFKRFREEHLEKNIKPLLNEMETMLRDSGIKAKIAKLIREGDPAREIMQAANEGKFSTIIMARRGLSEAREFLMGSISNKVVHGVSKQTVYVVGHRILEDKTCPVPRILVPVDGSTFSLKGVEHTACLASALKGAMHKITLLRVINQALFAERLKQGVDPFEEARKILDDAKSILLDANIPDNLIMTKDRVGIPSDEILREVQEGDFNLVVVGRKGRTALRDFILGGVSTTVLHRCVNPTIAIVSSK